MIIKVPNSNITSTSKTIVIDTDTYDMLYNRVYDIKIYPKHIIVKNKSGKRIPIWRLARRCFNSEFTVRYKDGDKYNIQRENLLLVRN